MIVRSAPEAICKVRYVRISPIKIRRIVSQIRGRSYKQAIIILSLLPHKSCDVLLKAMRSAASNYKQKFNSDDSSLMVKEIRVDNGPFLKRLCPHAQGRAFPIKKYFSHITSSV